MLALHGMGPKAVGILREHLAAEGLAFKSWDSLAALTRPLSTDADVPLSSRGTSTANPTHHQYIYWREALDLTPVR